MNIWKHWVARASTPFQPFEEFEPACWFWKKLENAFPEMVSGVLMPNHLHLILPQKVDASRRLAGLLAAMSVRCGQTRLWQTMPIPKEIPDTSHLRRQIRYLALNPCRKKLCKDPLEWYWSTYREVMGASIGSIQSKEKLVGVLKESSKTFQVRFHDYVSGDPSVSVTGTPFPKPAMIKKFPDQSIGEILSAASAALRVMPSQVRERGPLRHLFVHLAYRHGWRRASYLAQICEITPGAVHQILYKGAPAEIEAADLCLGDIRLRLDSGVDFLNKGTEQG